MVSDSVDAYVRQDVELAEQVIAHDDTVDDYFEQVKQGAGSTASPTIRRRAARLWIC